MNSTTNHMPTVSVVMSFYKEPTSWLRQSIDSILGQTFTDFEFIMVCDAPDNAEAIMTVRQYAEQDRRVKLIVNETNQGHSRAINSALSQAKGKYIAKMDADDISMPDRLKKEVAYLDTNPHIGVVSSDADIMDNKGTVIKTRRYRGRYSQSWLFLENNVAHPSVMYRREILKLRSPLYNEQYRYSLDYELWQYLLRHGISFHIIPESLILYRKSDTQISTAHREAQRSLFQRAHKELITTWLSDRGVCTGSLESMLEGSSELYRKSEGYERECLEMILYVLYFTLATHDRKYMTRYLSDRNFIAFRVKFSLTYRLLTSKRTRLLRPAYLELSPPFVENP